MHIPKSCKLAYMFLFFLEICKIDRNTIHLKVFSWILLSGMLILRTQVWISKILERKIASIFLPISFNICFGYSKEPSH